MGLFNFLPVKDDGDRTLDTIIILIIIINLMLGTVFSFSMGTYIMTRDMDSKYIHKCDSTRELMAYFFFQLCELATLYPIAILLTVAIFVERRRLFWTDSANVVLIIQWILSVFLLLQFLITKFNNKSWNIAKCFFAHFMFLFPYIVPIFTNPFFVFYANSFGILGPSTSIAGG